LLAKVGKELMSKACVMLSERSAATEVETSGRLLLVTQQQDVSTSLNMTPQQRRFEHEFMSSGAKNLVVGKNGRITRFFAPLRMTMP
jgi:hypothetical protein